jgi:hypothetical protein
VIRSLIRGRFALVAAALLTAVAPVANAQSLDVGTWTSGGCCSGRTRGYFFTAPSAFTITGLSVASAGSGGPGTLEVLRLGAVPPEFSGTTNNFVSLYYSATTAAAGLNIGINAGDIIGVLGYDAANAFTPYGTAESGYSSSIFGNAVTLYRFGFQSTGMALDVFQEPSNAIGVINMNYSASTVVPEPSTYLLMSTGCLAIFAVARRRRSA